MRYLAGNSNDIAFLFDKCMTISYSWFLQDFLQDIVCVMYKIRHI